MTDEQLQRQFLSFSAEVTAFSIFDLRGTGQATAYLSTVVEVVGQDILGELLDAYRRAVHEAKDDSTARAKLLYRYIFSDTKLGPIARNIIMLWYAGIWYTLPPEWRESFGARAADGTFVVGQTAYTQGLLWYAIGANPPGARAPGYGSWAAPPRIPRIEGDSEHSSIPRQRERTSGAEHSSVRG